MMYITGDLHGNMERIESFCRARACTRQDVFVLLGDVGLNYYGGSRDRQVKEALSRLGPVFFCIHGNHEQRPWNIPGYRQQDWNGGTVWYQEEYPRLLFARDGDIFTLEGFQCFVIGGAYSADKAFRLQRGDGWWADEQPNPEIRTYVEAQMGQPVDLVFSHTCPFRYQPVEMFQPAIDQSTVDASTEHWLDEIEEKLDYRAWFCGHWHTDKQVDRIHFMYHRFAEIQNRTLPEP